MVKGYLSNVSIQYLCTIYDVAFYIDELKRLQPVPFRHVKYVLSGDPLSLGVRNYLHILIL